MLLLASLALVLTGAGRISIDHAVWGARREASAARTSSLELSRAA